MVKPNTTVSQAEPEMACMKVIYSGGGFSNYFAMPSYQRSAVDYYLETYPPNYPSTIWNSTGIVSVGMSMYVWLTQVDCQSRGFPDISANGAVRICHNSRGDITANVLSELCCRCRRSIFTYIRDFVFFTGHWCHLHDDQRCPSCCREGSDWFH